MTGLYWITRTDRDVGYDEYASAVVVAETEERARAMHPGGAGGEDDEWVSPEHVDVEYLGEARPDLGAGQVICSDYWAS